MIRLLIADDERPARSELCFLLEKIFREKQCADALFYEAGSGAQVLELLDKHSFDACFLDIEMGDIKGTEIAERIRNKNADTAIIFVTAYENYAINAFDLDAVDYVMKPFDETRLKKAIDKLMQRKLATQKQSVAFALPAGDHMEVINADNISYIEAIHKGSKVHSRHQTYYSNEPLIEWEKKLEPEGKKFVRIHKSFIVNLDDCKALVPDYNNGYACKLKDYEDVVIPISRNMIHEVRSYFCI
ncbi:LytR/AlgR family response regulator transcription factor [Butyrivibrio sp. YAB3001]|uniref:LytR/AlgR family response regulator transcription factor n=1 Tax=Butyrivibrio sp. YAB3001 TaxID=1520812 RepID=UPI0008F65D02|nr:LytTR family DNA-binding domain-containing protein [Butyrivibrio sp. YAB3001]SFC90845.1 two component transcriptional regulator, LytTR family [Butyrivibrio sp. YAB3001]